MNVPLLIGLLVSLLVSIFWLIRANITATYWKQVATGAIADPDAHRLCQNEIADLHSKINSLEHASKTLREKNQKLEKVFEEKVKPVVNKAAEELASWIAEEEAELKGK